jgi:hypothetical protein
MKYTKYLVSLATEVDGHAQADAYIINVDWGKNAKEEILKKIFVLMDYKVEYEEGKTVFGTFDDHSIETRFSLSYSYVGTSNSQSQYSTGCRTDF